MKKIENISRLIVQDVSSLVLRRAEGASISIDAPEEVSVETKGNELIITEKRNLVEINNLPDGLQISQTKNGGISVKNVSGRNVSIINNQVWIDGKLFAGDNNKASKPTPTIVDIPDGIDLSLISCPQVTMEESHQLKEVYIQNTDIFRIEAKTIICNSANIICTGSSVLNIRTLKCPESVITVKGSAKVAIENQDVICCKMKISESSSLRLGKSNAKIIEIETSGSASCRVQHADHGKSLLQTSGASTFKVEGLLTEVVATSSGASTCKFSTPRNQPFITKKGVATCKAI